VDKARKPTEQERRTRSRQQRRRRSGIRELQESVGNGEEHRVKNSVRDPTAEEIKRNRRAE
jgi:hypothetical protein